MRKILSFVLALLVFLSMAGLACADDAGMIPGTEFPFPDTINSIKSVEVSEVQEKSILELIGVDMLFDIFYQDARAASQALGEYRSKMVLICPGLTDSKGNVLTLPDSTDSKSFSITVQLKEEPLSYIGMEEIGWFDVSSCGDFLKDPQYSQLERRMGISASDSLAVIQCEQLEFGDLDPDFAYVCNDLLRYFTRDNTGKEIPESENAYKNIEAEEIELDGAPAYKVSYEMEDPWGRCEMLSRVSYVTTNAAGNYIRINLTAPKEGTLDADGNPHRPSIADLSQIIEETYTRTEP